MTEAKVEMLKGDVAELESLLNQATRQKVKDLLTIEIRKQQSELLKIQGNLDSNKCEKPISSSCTNVSSAPKTYQIKINNYAWDQSNKFVKFYVTLDKVETVPSENVSCTFTSRTLEMTIRNLENKDYVFTIKNLLYNIVPETSTWKVKQGMVIINAAKENQQQWTHVTELEKKAGEKKLVPDLDKSADPQDSLMSLMKNMYQSGDDEMKRTIAKAWSESQNKNGPNGAGLPDLL